MESQLPEANFVGGHVSLLSGIGIQIDNIQSSHVYAITSDLPRLFVYSSKESVPEPERKEDYKPNDTFACSEKGAVTGAIFSSFISQELLPYIKKKYPDIKMGENELLLLIDMPSTRPDS